MRSSTAPIFSLSYFPQAQILRFTVQILSAILGSITIAQPGSANVIDSFKSNDPSNPVLTQRSTRLAQSAIAQLSTKILYVNSSDGRDTENGSAIAPFKTITHALKAAQAGTTILLASGTYSTKTGEVFPLVLKAGVTLQGDPATRGQDILIQGSGTSTHKAWTRQSLTIEISSPATLNGVTVTNLNPQGYGVGIDSSNPLIANSTFTGNDHGIAIAGNSTIRIQNNYFYQNREVGIAVAGIAQPAIQDNIFEQNGSAVIVSDRAAPLIANNRMTQNQNGMVFQGSAQPKVRNNSVEGNRQYGLLARDASRPDLGTVVNPGGNFFRSNGLFDVNVKATNQVISAVGNEWLNAVGTLNTTLTPASSNSAIAFPIPSALSANPPVEPSRPMQIVQVAMPSTQLQPAILLQSANSVQETSILQPSLLTSLPVPTSEIETSSQLPVKVQNLSAIAIPLPVVSRNAVTVPLLETFPLPPSSSTQIARLNIPTKPSALKLVQGNQLALSSSIASTPIPILVPPPERRTLRPDLELQPNRSIKAMIETPKVTKNASTNLLPVPSSDIPLGKIGDMPSVYGTRGVFQPSPIQNTTFSYHSPKVSSIRFRVVVNAGQATEQAQVLALVPDAFLITSTNNVMMQVGAFSDRTKAEQLTRTLASQGISSTIEPINQ